MSERKRDATLFFAMVADKPAGPRSEDTDMRRLAIAVTFWARYPWEHSHGFFLAGSVGHDFVAPDSVTLDFSRMVMTFSQSP